MAADERPMMEIRMPELLEALARSWRTQGITPRAGVSEAELRHFETRCGVAFPPDAAAYFRTMDGMPDDAMDNQLIRFWPLSEVKSADRELAPENAASIADYYLFADYSIWAHAYGLRLAGSSSRDVAIRGNPSPPGSSKGEVLDHRHWGWARHLSRA
jgi:cell wall assembly regulator SMI1